MARPKRIWPEEHPDFEGLMWLGPGEIVGEPGTVYMPFGFIETPWTTGTIPAYTPLGSPLKEWKRWRKLPHYPFDVVAVPPRVGALATFRTVADALGVDRDTVLMLRHETEGTYYYRPVEVADGTHRATLVALLSRRDGLVLDPDDPDVQRRGRTGVTVTREMAGDRALDLSHMGLPKPDAPDTASHE